ncbi:protein YIPF3 [Leptinotarsa decemlineata]|uniref:protein YIPF3 n=1 Tax=Leptinotarsa decemlineata TaxID=7539 RepID=UPI003D306D7D
MRSSVHFIVSHGRDKVPNNLLDLFIVSPKDILLRIFESFVPPVSRYKRVYVDLMGPLIGFILLTSFVSYGNTFKLVQNNITPLEFLTQYSILMPIVSYMLCKLGQSTITFYETVSLIGYSYYGHFLTLLISFIFFQEDNNLFYFMCLIIFGGFSTIRLILVFSGTIFAPAVRLLVCSSISVLNILCLIFLHFVYMHKTYNSNR